MSSFSRVRMSKPEMRIASFAACRSSKSPFPLFFEDYLLLLFFGSINQSELAEATDYLLQSFYPFESSFIQVTCQIEVNEQYHVYLQTRQRLRDMSIASIEEYTHTTIQFPQTGSERRTSVMIKGTPTQVCQARKFFDVREHRCGAIGRRISLSFQLCLPVILTFEVPRDREPARGRLPFDRTTK